MYVLTGPRSPTPVVMPLINNVALSIHTIICYVISVHKNSTEGAKVRELSDEKFSKMPCIPNT